MLPSAPTARCSDVRTVEAGTHRGGLAVSEPAADAQLEGFPEIRKPAAHLNEDVVADDFVLLLGST